MDKELRITTQQKIACEICGEMAGTESVQSEKFEYKNADDRISVLTANVPVISCSACDSEYTDGRAEIEKHDAICRHLGRLTSAEIRSVREAYGMSRSSFSRLTGIGIASLNRWENASALQSIAYDHFLRLLRRKSNFLLIENLKETVSSEVGPKFRCLERTETIERQASDFRLVS